jgi:hypothetical protein
MDLDFEVDDPGALSRLWSYTVRERSTCAPGFTWLWIVTHQRTLVFLFLHLAHTLDECRPEAASWISGILFILVSSQGWPYPIRLLGIVGVVNVEALTAWRGTTDALCGSSSVAETNAG